VEKTNQRRKGENMKRTILILALAAVLGCGPHQKPSKPESPPNEPVETQNPANAEPITGAFGWVLGQKLPEGLEVKPGNYYTEDDLTKALPFMGIIVDVLDDRTIFRITASADERDYFAAEEALEAKYGPGSLKKDNLEGVFGKCWSNNARQITLQGGRYGTRVKYLDLELQKKFDEAREIKMREEAVKMGKQL